MATGDMRKWVGTAAPRVLLHAAAFDAERVLATRAMQELTLGLESFHVAVGGSKWLGMTVLDVWLHSAPWRVGRVLATTAPTDPATTRKYRGSEGPACDLLGKSMEKAITHGLVRSRHDC